jgi:hypothetical protein
VVGQHGIGKRDFVIGLTVARVGLQPGGEALPIHVVAGAG